MIKKSKKLIAIIFCLINILQFFGQEIDSGFETKPVDPLIDMDTADAYYEAKNYRQALYFYQRAEKVDSTNARLKASIGLCYLNSTKRKKALGYFEQSLKLDPNSDKDIYFFLGQAYQLNEKWDEAIASYKKYLASLPEKELKKATSDIEKKIKECEFGKEIVKNPVNVKIENLGADVNSPFDDYTPMVSADESVLYFTSKRPVRYSNGTDGFGFENIFASNRIGDTWGKAQQLDEIINEKYENNSNVSLSIDKQLMILYREQGGGDFYQSDLKGNKWTVPKRLSSVINSKYHESAIGISYDSRKIYFVSDKPGGIGGKDIYESVIDEKGNFSTPKNIGSTINTPYDEEGVSIHPDGKTLYFSSKGHQSMGGYDIFKSVFENGTWSKPENIGYPINTADDDVFFIASANGKSGYYSSVREGGYGETDIYLISWINDQIAAERADTSINSGASTAQLTLVKGAITDNQNNPLEATVEIVDLETDKVVAKYTSNSATGGYLFSLPSGKNYGFTVSKEGYLFYSENANIPLTAGFEELTKPIVLEKIKIDNKIVLNNIFFDFNKATLRKESKSELRRLVKLLNENKEMRVEISAHTDNKGTPAYNQLLSETRAYSVKKYLVAKGIKAKRIDTKGYGLNQPATTNDTKEGRQLNRRAEFKVIN